MASTAFDRAWHLAFAAEAPALLRARRLHDDGAEGTPIELVRMARTLLAADLEFNAAMGLTPDGELPGDEKVLVAETFYYIASKKDLPRGAVEEP